MSLAALRVRVVEDHGFQRRLALRLLAELGIEHVMEAADGMAALVQLEAGLMQPDVILVDLDMPGMDGIEFIGHVAQRRLARGVALVSALDPALSSKTSRNGLMLYRKSLLSAGLASMVRAVKRSMSAFAVSKDVPSASRP